MNVIEYLNLLFDEPKYFLGGNYSSCYYGECGDICTDHCNSLCDADAWAQLHPKTASRAIQLWYSDMECSGECPCDTENYCYIKA